jgi:hypothetical protein
VIKFTSCLPLDRCFSPGTPVSSTTKTGRHDIAEILLKVELKLKKLKKLNKINHYRSPWTFKKKYAPEVET